MPLDTIYIARHGYRSNWLPEPHAPSPTGIDSDPALAPHGVDQAHELAQYLLSIPEHERPQLILLSPFYRCVETAEPISRLLGIPVALERGVGEWYKKNRPVIPAPADYGDLARFFDGVLIDESKWPRDTSLGVIPDLSGETEDDILDRAHRVKAVLPAALERAFPDVKRILIMTHAATKIALGLALLDLASVRSPLHDGSYLRAGACSLDKYVSTENNQWSLEVNGACHFLENGEEMNWTFNLTYEAGSDEDIKERMLKSQASLPPFSTPTSAQSAAIDTANTQYEDIYVSVGVPTRGKPTTFDNQSDTPHTRHAVIKPAAQWQVAGLTDPYPLAKLSNNSGAHSIGSENQGQSLNVLAIDGKVYATQWKLLVGTELIFDDYGDHIATVREHLACLDNLKVTANEKGSSTAETSEQGSDNEVADESLNAFMRKALKFARKSTPSSK